jgi:hypothetical protein
MVSLVTTVSCTPIKFAYKASFVKEVAEEFCVEDRKINQNHVINQVDIFVNTENIGICSPVLVLYR